LLLLTRREKESVVIDGDIWITVEAIHDGSVTIEIDAPWEITTLRLADSEVGEIMEGVTVMLTGIQGITARLGFTAPKGMTIHREEIQIKVDQEAHDRAMGIVSGAAA
jgi:carbon storage regulator CsrA